MTAKGAKLQQKAGSYEYKRVRTAHPSKSPRNPSWAAFPPSVLGSLVIRLATLGYGCLFGSTSDGGRLTLSLYRDGYRQSCYFGPSATVAELLREVGALVGVVVATPQPVSEVPGRPPAALGALEWCIMMGMSPESAAAAVRQHEEVDAWAASSKERLRQFKLTRK